MKLELLNSYSVVRRHGINIRTLIDWKEIFQKSAFLCIRTYVSTNAKNKFWNPILILCPRRELLL